jgi:hypothetical protein
MVIGAYFFLRYLFILLFLRLAAGRIERKRTIKKTEEKTGGSQRQIYFFSGAGFSGRGKRIAVSATLLPVSFVPQTSSSRQTAPGW